MSAKTAEVIPFDRRKLAIAYGDSDPARITRTGARRWRDVVAEFSKTPPEAERKDAGGWFIPGSFKRRKRNRDNLDTRDMLTFDFDNIEPADVDAIREAFLDFEYVMFPTYSSSDNAPRLRVLFPLSRAVTPDEFECISRTVGELFDIDKLANESHNAAQMMYMPARKPGADWRAEHNEADWIDPDEILGDYSDWTDREQWPRAANDHVGTGEKAGDPREKPGIVGDFCRAFSITEAIERFDLPYSPGSNGRYTYDGGSRPDGLRIYDDDSRAHSEHDTDPAHGQHCAWDLVRLHKFGHLDKVPDRDLPVEQRPSHKAMIEKFRELPEVQQSRVEGEFEPLPDEPVEVDDKPRPRLFKPLKRILETRSSVRWLLRGWFERGVISLIVGPRATYKSFLLLDRIMRIALTGESVAIISAEGSGLDRRIRAWLQTYAPDVDLSKLKFQAIERRLNLLTGDDLKHVREELAEIRPAIVGLDTLRKLAGDLDENDNSKVAAFIGRIDLALRTPLDCTVALVVHTGHNDKNRARGASALGADTDSEFIVTPAGDESVTVSRERFKDAPSMAPAGFAREIVDLGYTDDDGERVTSCVLREQEPARSARKSEPKGPVVSVVLKTARDLCKNGPDSIEPADLVTRVIEITPHDENSRSTEEQRRYNIMRAVKKLTADGYLFMRADGTVTPHRATVADDADFEEGEDDE